MAKKPTVTTVASGYYGRQALNDNFEALRDAFDNTLSRDGSTPNAMGADLDMNSNDILNAQTINTSQLILNGSTVTPTGLTASGASVVTDQFTGDGSTTSFTLSYAPQIKDHTGVFIDGVYQNKAGYSITSTTLTFDTAPPLNSAIEVQVFRSLLVGSTPATNVSYNQGGTGAIDRTAQVKLQEFVSVKDFGAVGDGVTDDTTALKAAFDYAIPLGIPVHLEGSFRVTGPIQSYVSGFRASGEAHIVCKGAVTITVDAASTGFRDLFYLETTAVNNCSITGGSLYINCNNKAASGITFRHNAASQGGQVNIECPVTIVDCYNTDAAATYENQAISVYGDYESVLIDQPRVVGVSRAGSGGATKGIGVAAFTGVVTINQPYVKNVLTGGGTFDADGIATFGKLLGTTYNARGGSVRLNEPTFIDCQGRSFKSQCSDTTVMRPKVYRQNVVSIANGADFDFQFGGTSLLVDPLFEYRLDGVTSPLGASFTSVVFQQLLDNQQNVGKSIGGTILTEALIPRYASIIHQTTALESYTEVNGLIIQPIGALTDAIDRAIVEFRGDNVEAKSTKTHIVVHDVRGPIGTYPIGYTDYVSGSLASKLNIEISDCYNTLASPTLALFNALSGSSILEVESFLFRENYGFRSLVPAGWTFDFNNLVTGSYFTVDIATVSATNAPSWGASGYAYIEVLDQWFNTADQHIRVTVDNAAASNTVFFTQGGTTPTWGTIK